jgi:hypothetical protein
MGRGNSNLSGAFNPGEINPSLVGAFNPRMGSTQLDSGLESTRSMMDMAAQYRATLPEEAVPEFFTPSKEQDDFYRAQYEATGYIPQGGWESIYEDSGSLQKVYVGDKAHYAPSNWSPESYIYKGPVYAGHSNNRYISHPAHYKGETSGVVYRGNTKDADADPRFSAIEKLHSGSNVFGGRPPVPNFGSTGSGVFGAPAVGGPVWRMNGGGLVRGYFTGGPLEAAGDYAGGPVASPGQVGPPPMSPVQMGLGAAPQAMGGMSVQDIGASLGEEELRIIAEEVRQALMGNHPNGDQVLAIATEMFGPEFIQEIASSIQGGGMPAQLAGELPGAVAQGNPMMGAAGGGLIRGYQSGGVVSDGMSDSIPGMLGSEPIAVSEGEYIVPAREVAALGNGSTDAGGRALDRMVKQIRMATTGAQEQAPAIDPRRFFPGRTA